jgi:membrane protein YqaA with SNARE-associated domain
VGRVVVAATYLWCLLSALVPVVNAEVYLLGVSVASSAPPWLLALAAAAGQVTGKIVFYLVGLGVLDLRRVRRRGTAAGRWTERLTAAQRWADRHRWGPAGLCGVSAVTGLPPFAVVSLLAGTLRVRWWLFVLTAMAGRYVRFLLVLLTPGLLPDGWLAGLG